MNTCVGLLTLSIVVTLARSAEAQKPSSPQPAKPVMSMGQPPRFLPYGAALGFGSSDGGGFGGLFGVARPILNPVVGLLNANGEAYVQARSPHANAGLRVLGTVPALGFGIGADWSVTRGHLDPAFTFQTAIRRGGLFGHGSMLRVDWLPTRDHELGLGVTVPIDQPFAGRTRQRRTRPRIAVAPAPRAEQTSRLPAAAEQALGTLARDGALIAAFTNLYTDGDQAVLHAAGANPEASSYDAVLRSSDNALAAAFAAVVSDTSVGRRAAERARAIVLDGMILPYDALFGQAKDGGALPGFASASRARFARWLADSSRISGAPRRGALAVFDRWTGGLVDLARQLRDNWNDSRLVWLPAQLALTPDQFDEQAEVDDLVGRVAGHPFTDDNDLAYLRTADLPLEIARSIMAARRYHVLWTHDFANRSRSGHLDEVAYTIVADAYLPALTAAVQRYDSTGTMPQYIVLLDAYYYHANDERMWMSVLESPLTATVSLRADEAAKSEHLDRRLAALREAVAHSRRLQREAAANGGSAWLDRVVRVNVNIVLPSDFSFRSSRILPPLPFTPDNVIRDHRKVVLYDYTEANPYDGELLVTGVGIGDHYASATWRDRGYRVRGPAALEMRVAVRQAFTSNGFRADQIPEPLRAVSNEFAGTVRADASPGVGRALNVYNEPGFGWKHASAARAMLYTLAPPGSDIVVPDPLWLSESWTGMLLGAAARGCRVAIITPAARNSPNPEATIFAAQNFLLHRMLGIRQRFASRIRDAGGAFHIGLFNSTATATDIGGRYSEIRAGLARAPWIREMIPFDSSVLASLERASTQATRTTASAILANDEKPRDPQLHQKTQLIARPGALEALVRQPGWERVLARTLIAESRETARLADALAEPEPPADTAAVRATQKLLTSYEKSLSEADRKRLSFYFAVGSQNHDTRGLLLDGEANVIVSGVAGSSGVVDLFYLMARTTWVNTDAEIDRLLPPRSGLFKRIAKAILLVL